jgi:hypothetical protein
MTRLDLALAPALVVIALPPRYDPAIRLKEWIDE